MNEAYNYKKINHNRKSGVLLAVTSLPSPFGVGTMGAEAYQFIDFLADSGQTYWQVLPLGTTGYGNSPYQNFSTRAGNPYLIDLRWLVQHDLLPHGMLEGYAWGSDPSVVDYGALYQNSSQILKQAFNNYLSDEWGHFGWLRGEFEAFIGAESAWLHDFALFMTLKEEHGGGSWQAWELPFKTRDAEALQQFANEHQWQIRYQCFVQFLFFRQWRELRRYAHDRSIQILGDVPIYVAEDSVEVWRNPQYFLVGADLAPTFVAGCPPDYFSEDGQLWGNPLYDWTVMASDNYVWWAERLAFALKIYDVIRIDHFRGFESFWAVPNGDLNARRGLWVKGPGNKLFESLRGRLGELPLIAEDLGYMTKAVSDFREETGIPGMKVLQFGFNPDATSDYLPHNLVNNCVLYTGTHDNDTIAGWLEVASEAELEFATAYMGLNQEEGMVRGIIRGAMTTVAETVILQMQDLLELDNRARFNSPGILDGNWQWRFDANAVTPEITRWLYQLTKVSSRLRKHK